MSFLINVTKFIHAHIHILVSLSRNKRFTLRLRDAVPRKPRV